MFSLFKRKSATEGETTFKQRVRDFWGWYAEVGPRFFQTIEAGECQNLITETSAHVDKLFPDFAWVFGTGAGGEGHSFTLSGEGVSHRQLLTRFWHSQAPRLDGWTFYPARQPGSIKGMEMEIGGQKFKPTEFWLVPTINEQSKKVHIIAWHPLFSVLGRKDCLSALFLFLDEVLGEYGTGQWIGEIKLGEEKMGDAIPLEELPAYIKKLEIEKGWKKLPPGETATGYQLKERHRELPRGDIITGTTMHPHLINEYLANDANLADPLAGTGADFVYVVFDAKMLPQGKQVQVRGEIEGILDKQLRSSSNGQLIGGAMVIENAYIDLLLFDGAESINTVRKVLVEQNLPAGTAIHYFAREKRGHRIVL